MAKPPEDQLPEKEVAKRRDSALLNALRQPPKPHAEIVGKGKAAGNRMLTPEERKKLAQKAKATDEYAKKVFSGNRALTAEERKSLDRKAKKGVKSARKAFSEPSAKPEKLSPEELEKLRQNGKEASASMRKTFAHMRPKAKKSGSDK